MRVHLHIGGVLFFIATLTSVYLIPGMTRDVHADVPLPFSGDAVSEPRHDVLVVFAGYPGCNDVCPMTLSYLDRAYRAVDDERMGVAFLNVLLETPTRVSDSYAKSFHPEFVGYTVAPTERAAVYRQMGLKTDARIENVAAHKNSLFIYARTNSGWSLKHVLTTPPAIDSFVARIDDLMGDERRS